MHPCESTCVFVFMCMCVRACSCACVCLVCNAHTHAHKKDEYTNTHTSTRRYRVSKSYINVREKHSNGEENLCHTFFCVCSTVYPDFVPS